MIYLSFVKLYFSSTFNYVQFNYINLNINVSALPSAPHVRLQNRQCHAFLQERIQNAVQWSEKSHLERARPKKYESIHPSQKVAEESQKNKFINFQTHLKLNTLVICVLTANTLMRHSVSLNVRSFVLFLFLPLLQQLFQNNPAN